nr:MAG TPA: hypothetical protein [Caudoviricetes sp.]
MTNNAQHKIDISYPFPSFCIIHNNPQTLCNKFFSFILITLYHNYYVLSMTE